MRKMTAFAFSLPILPGQEEEARRIGELVSGSGELREEYDELRKSLESVRRRCGYNELPQNKR